MRSEQLASGFPGAQVFPLHAPSEMRMTGGAGPPDPSLSLMTRVSPVILEGHGVRLEPLAVAHCGDLAEALADGELWTLWYTSTPDRGLDGMAAYVDAALEGQRQGHMLPWAVRDLRDGRLIGTTRYHDIVAAISRVEIGYTWYTQRAQRTHVNTACKLMLMGHAFEALACRVVGFRTDAFNFRSQRAIEGLGARKDGVLRGFGARRNGEPRDTVMYSVISSEWPDVRQHLEFRLSAGRHVPTNSVPD